jgi:hypothetical protein
MMKREYSGGITNKLENDTWHNVIIVLHHCSMNCNKGTTIDAPFLMFHCSTIGRIQGETAWNTRYTFWGYGI